MERHPRRRIMRRRSDARDFDPRSLRTRIPNGGDELEVEAPGGWKGKLRGNLVIVLVMVALAVGAIIYFVDRSFKTHETVLSERRKVYQADHKAIVDGMTEVIKQARIQTYMISLTPEERKKLGLDEPQELWDARRGRR